MSELPPQDWSLDGWTVNGRFVRWQPQTRRVLGAMRSGEWLRTQWIARVAFDLGNSPGPHPEYSTTQRRLVYLQGRGIVEHRLAPRQHGHPVGNLYPSGTVPFGQKMSEWRLLPRSQSH